jgi:glutamate-1-semialdehyde 2,1-aminomutase
MHHISPLGAVYQAGTLSGNPLATAAGIKTLEILNRTGVFDGVDQTTKEIAEGLEDLIQKGGHTAVVQRAGTMMTLFFSSTPVTNFIDAKACDHQRFGRFHGEMLKAGVYLPPSGYEACFISAAHGPQEIEIILKAAQHALEVTA